MLFSSPNGRLRKQEKKKNTGHKYLFILIVLFYIFSHQMRQEFEKTYQGKRETGTHDKSHDSEQGELSSQLTEESLMLRRKLEVGFQNKCLSGKM